MPLTREDIRYLLEMLAQETEHQSGIRYMEEPGYSEDPKRGALQAKLSIMLEATAARGDQP